MILNIIPQILRENCEAYAKRLGSNLCSHLIGAEGRLIRFTNCGDFKVKLINQNAGRCKTTLLQKFLHLDMFLLILAFKALNIESRL